jgi:Cdc6-like AAA superfamily ATPase
MAMLQREREVRAAFSPSAPISKRDLFAGRTSQMIELVEAVDEPGQHVVLFGERGAGKTSLSAVTAEVLSNTTVTVRVNCQSSDSFSSIWSRVFNEIILARSVAATGFGSTTTVREQPLTDAFNLPPQLTPDEVRATLAAIALERPVAIFIDEFDRVTSGKVHRAFSDLLKALSDHGVPATIVIVGVADNVSELIAEHASVERALNQISMPRMSRGELAEIVTRGFGGVGLTIDSVALNRITTLSQGLPHYTHLLAQQAGVDAVLSGSDLVDTTHVEAAIKKGLERTQESIASLYYRATYSARENLYKQVLLACAAANADERGFFSAASVREVLSGIVGRRMDIPQFAMHLNAFSSERGPVLRKEGSQRKFRYRFVNPLLQPYVLMRGLSDQLISPELLDEST